MGKYTQNQLLGGMVSDSEGSKSTNGNLEFMLNGVYDNAKGGLGSIHTEGGCELQLLSAHRINGIAYFFIGHVDLTPNKKVIFLTNNSGEEMLAYFQYGKITPILTSNGVTFFNLNTKYPVGGIGRIRRGTDEVIYWNDGHNADRFLIVNKLDIYYTNGVFRPNLTLFNGEFRIPNVTMLRADNVGGSIELGSYKIAFQYEDILGNTSEVFFISNTFFAGRGIDAGIPSTIEGGYNVQNENWAASDEAYIPQNKSFTFRLEGLDPDYNVLKVYALQYTGGTGVLNKTNLIDNITIDGRPNINWTFRGVRSYHEEEELAAITSSYSRYETSQAMAHIQNYLIKANVSEVPYDWAKFQKYITQSAKVKWVVKDVAIDTNVNNSSGAYGGYINSSAIRNEVQAIGVTVIFTDGTESPVFNIPGRQFLDVGETYTVDGITYGATRYNGNDRDWRNYLNPVYSWDKQLLTVVDGPNVDTGAFDTMIDIPNNDIEIGINSAKPFGLTVGQTIERWKVYNTAIHDLNAVTESGYVRSGIFGYYEVDTRYPEIVDSDGDVVFPHTIVAGNVVMDKVRHHRFPTTSMCSINTGRDGHSWIYGVPVQDPVSDHIYPMGIKVFDIEFPPEYENDIVGIKLYYGDRTADKTVVDKGLAMVTGSNNSYDAGTPQYVIDAKHQTDTYSRWGGWPYDYLWNDGVIYHSTDFDTGGGAYGIADYMQIETSTAIDTLRRFDIHEEVDFHQYDLEGYINTQFTYRAPANIANSGTLQNVNRIIYDSKVLDAGETYYYNYFENTAIWGGEQRALQLSFNREWLFKDENNGVSVGTGNAGTYVNPIYGGRPTGHQGYQDMMYYVSLRTIADIFEDVRYINYNAATDQVLPIATTYESQGIDCFINSNTVMSSMRREIPGNIGGVYQESSVAAMWTFWSESQSVNYGFRHQGTGAWQSFYPADTDVDKYLDPRRNHNRDSGQGFAHQFIAINPDYSILPSLSTRTAWDTTIDYTNDRLGKFPVRIIWSNKSHDEELIDRNLLFSALDYDDLSSDKGEIRMLSQKPNMLYAITDYSIFSKPTNTQQMELSGATAVLKQSSFLDIAETELFETGTGYGGCQHRFAHVDTEFGTFYVNQYKGEVYLLNKNIVPLDAKGMSWRLRDILPSKFMREFEATVGYKYPLYDATTAQHNGIGVRCYYDPLYKRAIITKIDYEFITPFAGILPDGQNPNPNVLYWDNIDSVFRYGGGIVDMSFDTDHFRRRHLTLSYDFRSQKWASFHSWIPRAGMSDTENMYTYPAGDDYWYKHILHNYLNYYDDGVRFPFIIEWNTPNLERATVNQASWISRCGIWDEDHNRYKPVKGDTFTDMIMYTDYQSTGAIRLVDIQDDPFAWVNLDNDARPLKRHDKVWRVHNLWDYRIVESESEPAMTENINIPEFFNIWYQGLTGGYIDAVPNPAATDVLKMDLFNTAPIDDEYVSTRLIYNNQTLNCKLTVDMASLFKQHDLT